MEGVIIKQDSPDWVNMWEWLSEHPINKGLKEPKTALNKEEAWQYMGSLLNDGVLISDFRHRRHPTTNDISRLSYQHPEFDEANFEYKKKIK